MNTTTLNMTTLDGGNVIIKIGEGGGATINNQDKAVDITENGTTEVVADGGYTGLGKVTINTEVSGGESGGVKLYYTKSSAFTANDLQYAVSTKLKGTGVLPMGAMIGMIVDLETTLSNITAIMVSPTKMKIGETVIELNEEALREMYKDGFTEITEEQFYTLD